jgi:hypothetical protein
MQCNHTKRRSMFWAAVEALAYAGAIYDPTGALATQRFRWDREGAK